MLQRVSLVWCAQIFCGNEMQLLFIVITTHTSTLIDVIAIQNSTTTVTVAIYYIYIAPSTLVQYCLAFLLYVTRVRFVQ